MVAGDTPNSLNSDKLGEFIRQVSSPIQTHPRFALALVSPLSATPINCAPGIASYDLPREWQVGRAINNRPVYSQVGNDERMLW